MLRGLNLLLLLLLLLVVLLLDSSRVHAHPLHVVVLERSHSKVVLHPMDAFVLVARRRLLALSLVELGNVSVLEDIALRHATHCLLAKLRLGTDNKVLITWLRILVLRAAVTTAHSLRFGPIELQASRLRDVGRRPRYRLVACAVAERPAPLLLLRGVLRDRGGVRLIGVTLAQPSRIFGALNSI